LQWDVFTSANGVPEKYHFSFISSFPCKKGKEPNKGGL